MNTILVQSPVYMDVFLVAGAIWFLVDAVWTITHWSND